MLYVNCSVKRQTSWSCLQFVIVVFPAHTLYYFCSKMVNFLFSACFGGHFCYHSSGKSQTNTRLIHLGHCPNKPIRRIGEKRISFFGLIGGQKKPLNARSSLNYLVHSSEKSSGLVVHTTLKPCALLVIKGVTFRLSTTVAYSQFHARSDKLLKTIWPIIKHPNDVTYILISIVDTQCWQVKRGEFM